MKPTTINAILFNICLLLFLSSLSLAQNFDLPITTSSKEARNIFLEGRAYLENVHTAKAAKLFDKAIQLDPNFAMAHVLRAGTFIGGFSVAREHINKAVELVDIVTGGEKNIILYQQAINNGDQVRQKMFLDNLIVSFPYNKRIQQIAGNYYFGISDYENSLIHFKKSVEIDKNFAPSYNMIGYAESSLENFDAAEIAFKMYIQLLPNHPNPYDSYAELLLKMGKYDESIIQYKKAHDLDKSFTTALIGIGHNYIFKKEFEKGREYYNMSLNSATSINQKLSSLFWTATSFIHENNSVAAMKVLSKRKNLAKKEGLITTVIGATNLEGFILTEMGQAKKGMKKFKFANRMVETSDLPKSVKANLALNGKLNICYSLTANNRITEADKEAQMCEQMVNKRGNRNEIQNLHRTLARLEMKKGNYKNAISHFEKTDLTNNPFSLHKVGFAYEQMGNKTKANEYYNKFKTSNQNGIGYALIRQTAKD